MRKILLSMLIVLAMLAVPVMASDSVTPYTTVVKWTIPSTTTFTVTICSGASDIHFQNNLTSPTQAWVQPDCQNNASSTPMLTIVNDANQNLNFTGFLNASIYSWAQLFVNNDTDTVSSIEITGTSPTFIFGHLPSGNSSSLYFWTNVTDAPVGSDYAREFTLNSTASND